jgi:hypothetical protein
MSIHGGCLLFVAVAAGFTSDGARSDKASCAEEPAGQNGFAIEGRGLAGQNQKDRLGDVLGQVRVANLAQGGGVNQVEVPVDQFGKGFIGFLPSPGFDEFVIGHNLQPVLPLNPRLGRKGTTK